MAELALVSWLKKIVILLSVKELFASIRSVYFLDHKISRHSMCGKRIWVGLRQKKSEHIWFWIKLVKILIIFQLVKKWEDCMNWFREGKYKMFWSMFYLIVLYKKSSCAGIVIPINPRFNMV